MFLLTIKQLQKPLLISLCFWCLALVAILWIDKPLALLIHQHGWDYFLLLRAITEWFPIAFTLLILGLIFLYYWRKLGFFTFGLCLYFYLSLQLTMVIKVILKIVFGRYWPNTWNNHNLSLIHDGVYGFNWWHGFANQGSFPSSHLTYCAFCCIWLITIAPTFRKLWYFLLALLTITMVILNYHFLGDCLAGIGLGILGGFISVFYLPLFETKLKHARKK